MRGELARRSAAVRDARAPAAFAHDILLGAAVAALAAGIWGHVPEVAVAAGLLTGLELGRRSADPDHAYLEGFTDGAAAADRLAEADDRGPASRELRELPAGPGDAEPLGTDGRAVTSLRPPRAPEQPGFDLRAVAGIELGDGPARPTVGPDGQPLRVVRPLEPAADDG